MTDAALQTAVRIDAETPADFASVEALVMAAFGPGRYAKTAERIREQAGVAAGFVAREDGRVIGAVRLWTIMIGDRPALFLGPITVSADSRKGGLGADLVQACIDHAGRTGVLLVGDAPYFGRFGFRHAPEVRLQGPVDPRRVLWLGEGEPSGTVRPA